MGVAGTSAVLAIGMQKLSFFITVVREIRSLPKHEFGANTYYLLRNYYLIHRKNTICY